MKKVLIIIMVFCLALSTFAFATQEVEEEIDDRANINISENQTYTFAATDFSTRFNALDVGALTDVIITSLPTEEQGVLSISNTPIEEEALPKTIAIASITTLKFEPAADFTGTASFNWKGKATDLTVQEVFTTNLIVSSPTNIVNINMKQNEVYQYKANDFTEKFALLDVGDLTRVVITELPSNGTLKVNDTAITTVPTGIDISNIGTLTFIPDEDYVGTSTFTWRGRVNNVSDETVFTTNMIVSRAVPENTVNIYVNKNETYRFKKTDFSTEFGLLNAGTLSSVVIETMPETTKGVIRFNTATIELLPYTVSLSQIGLLTFTPPTDFIGTATFTWTGKVDSDANETVFTTNIIVQEPTTVTALNDSFEVDKNTTLNGTLKVSQDVDVVFAIVTDPTHGTISNLNVETGEFAYIPNADYTGADQFTFKASYENADGDTVESNVATISINVQEAGNVIPFHYVDMQKHWANYSASHLAAMDIFVGEKISNEYFFRPETPITRADFVMYMLSVLDIPARDKTVSFTFADDATIEDWLKPYIYTAYQESIINGSLENGKIYFNPNSPITRVEAAKIINDSMKFKVQNTATLKFTDVNSIPSWATTSVKNMVGYEIIKGYDDNTFRPMNNINKGELAEMLYKALREKQIEINTAE